MPTREAELPGVGTKYSFTLAGGDQLVAVHHRVGHWELARVDTQGQTSAPLRLQPREAAELGRILSQREESTEDPRKQMLFESFSMEWVRLEAGSPLIGTTLRSSEIRPRTGASVIAVLRSDASIPSPPPDTTLQLGDTLVLIGHPSQIDSFMQTFSSGSASSAAEG